MAESRLKLTRAQLAAFLKDQESIRQFEKLFAVADFDVPSTAALAEEASIDAGNALARAEQAFGTLSALALALAELEADVAAIGSAGGYANALINGSMRIFQRNLSSSGTGDNPPVYVADQWILYQQANGSGSTIAWERSGDVPSFAAAGIKFERSLKLTMTNVGFSVNNLADYGAWVYQPIERFRFERLLGQPCTLSLWIKASVTGTYTAFIYLPLANLNARVSFTIDAANTWEKKTLVFSSVPDANIGVPTDYSAYVGVIFGAGSANKGAPLGAETYPGWYQNASNYGRGVSAQANLPATINATIFLTGVDLRSGSAGAIEIPPLDTDMYWCMRHFEKSYPHDTTPGTAFATTYESYGVDYTVSDTYTLTTSVRFRVPKRIAPVYSVFAGNGINTWSTTGQALAATRLVDMVSVLHNAQPVPSAEGFVFTHTLSVAEPDTRRAFQWAASDVRIF